MVNFGFLIITLGIWIRNYFPISYHFFPNQGFNLGSERGRPLGGKERKLFKEIGGFGINFYYFFSPWFGRKKRDFWQICIGKLLCFYFGTQAGKFIFWGEFQLIRKNLGNFTLTISRGRFLISPPGYPLKGRRPNQNFPFF